MKFLKICFLMSFVVALQASNQGGTSDQNNKPERFIVIDFDATDPRGFKETEIFLADKPELCGRMKKGKPDSNNVFLAINKGVVQALKMYKVLKSVDEMEEFIKEGGELDQRIARIEHKEKAKPFLDAIKAREQKE